MRLTDDLTSRKAILWKGWLFFVLGLLAFAALLMLFPDMRLAALSGIVVWAFCRWYYFMCYVIEHYVDSTYRFAGLSSFLRYMFQRRSRS